MRFFRLFRFYRRGGMTARVSFNRALATVLRDIVHLRSLL